MRRVQSRRGYKNGSVWWFIRQFSRTRTSRYFLRWFIRLENLNLRQHALFYLWSRSRPSYPGSWISKKVSSSVKPNTWGTSINPIWGLLGPSMTPPESITLTTSIPLQMWWYAMLSPHTNHRNQECLKSWIRGINRFYKIIPPRTNPIGRRIEYTYICQNQFYVSKCSMNATDAKATLLVVVPNLHRTMSAIMHIILAILVATWDPCTQRETISQPTQYTSSIWSISMHIHKRPELDSSLWSSSSCSVGIGSQLGNYDNSH